MPARTKGSSIAEAPAVLWFLIVVILLPLLNLATACVRAYFLYDACHKAALSSAKARSFEVSGSSPSAVVTADRTARDIAGRFQGVRVTQVRTVILAIDTTTRAKQVFASHLTTPPNTSQFAYEVQVTVQGQVDPIFLFDLGYFIDVPGVTAPIPLTITDQALIENTQGLTR